ncbi:TIM-barrel domain-containing protein [Enterococcus faecalis]|uniref:TIM-barrel domain-containing protein n=1 Tax=Enterococcus faecalis TaxID=1351 RepID=UPI001BAB45EB|nr:TIM-barrel domain-containing protein [Enterococcus faecalis]MBS0709933.1 FIVAR domain-containing protein [Enterococcus faecalis]MDT2186030.1 glycoside hydrolase family 31 protein [Enterococcus faecalis]
MGSNFKEEKMNKEYQGKKIYGKKHWLTFLLVSSSVLAFHSLVTMDSQVVDAQEQTAKEDVADSATSVGAIVSIEKAEKNFVITYASGKKAQISILNDHLFRYHLDPTGKFEEYPTPNDPKHVAKITAKTMADYGTQAFEQTNVTDSGNQFILENNGLKIMFEKESALMEVLDKKKNQVILEETAPLSFKNDKATQTLKQSSQENYFGGGTQNGRFTHKGTAIQIVNTNNWVDGGVASPNPFYWSTAGYGVVRNTWKPGNYDFGSHDPQTTTTTHEGTDFDAFYFFNDSSAGILKDYYELTGKPALMPEYGFYEAHLNAYNRDYWVKVAEGTAGAVKFEDGNFYKEYQPGDLGNLNGTLESLNGEKENYQFSARAVIDRYKKNDMPLGWFLPNDGYGAGYGQTDSLDGDVQNLKEFTEYAQANGVEVGLWTQSNLHPADPKNPKKGERDIAKEVSVAGVKALKTDVAWVGYGYSFGLNGVEDAANVFVKETDGAVRPMIVSLDGWAGTQRHAGIWTGDQTGGQWEYIRFHIPTYIGTSLSGQPNVGSDMDGIFGGKNKEVNIRDFQWKTFTPVQLNMDGWGSNPKTPFAFDQEATDLNRAYLKLKSMMMPYNYSIAKESVDGLPMVRAMALEFPNEGTAYTKDSQYQYMWGPNLLVAPIYNGNQDEAGNSIRDGIYLPDEKQVWVDLFTGEKYQGGRVLNGVKTPLWKVPVFVKDGSIIPMTNPNNNPKEIQRDQRSFLIYPNGTTSFNMYEDDGISTSYEAGQSATTKINSQGPKSNEKGDLTVTIEPTKGSYKGFVDERSTTLDLLASEAPESVTAMVGGTEVTLKQAANKEEFLAGTNLYYFDKEFQVNQYLSEASGEKLNQSALSVKLAKQSVTAKDVQITVKGFINKGTVDGGNTTVDDQLTIPANVAINEEKTTPSSLTLQWDQVTEATSYEVERDGTVFGNIQTNTATFDGFSFLSEHTFRVRAVGKNGVSEWSEPIKGKTQDDPYKETINQVKATSNLPEQPGAELKKLTDKDLSTGWHTNWSTGIANPSDGNFLSLKFDLGAEYQMDKIEYLPRDNAGNGNILQLQYRTSKDGANWTEFSEPINWKQDALTKTIETKDQAYRFVEMKVLKSVGNFGSGREMLFYKQPGTEGILHGDITNDGTIDENDAMSYRNYTGLESVDSDFNGYVEKGDLNKNGVIDAYDISYVLRQLDGGIEIPDVEEIAGGLSLAVVNENGKDTYLPGDTLTFTLKGQDLKNINALSTKMSFDSSKFELVGQPATTNNTKQMENYSKYRKHSNGVENLYLVLSNQGNKQLLNGSMDLVTFKVKVKETTRVKHATTVEQPLQFDMSQGLLVGQGFQQATLSDFSVTVKPTELVDKELLQALITLNQARVEKEYTPETWAIFKPVLDEAVAVLANEQATQTDVSAAVENLEKAASQLEKMPDVANKADLEKAIQEGLAKKPSDGQEFTEETKKVLEDSLAAAQKVFAQEKVTQEEIDQVTKTLREAIAQLKEQPVAVDKETLKEKIAQARGRKPEEGYQFTKETEKQLQEAIQAAEAIVAKETATKEEVSEALNALETAMAQLKEVPLVNKDQLQEVVKRAQQVTPSEGHQFTASSLQDLQKALLAAKNTLENPAANQKMIDEAVAELTSAIDGLQEEALVTDKKALEAMIAKAKAIKPSAGKEFTSESKARLTEAIDQAEGILADKNARQEQIDTAEKNVKTALDSLEEQVLQTDKTKLKELLQKAETLKPKAGKQFTKASQEALAEAIKQAKALVEDPNATQEAVDKCLSILAQAIEAMAEEPISSNSTGNNGNHGTVSGTGGVTSPGKGTAAGGTTTKTTTSGTLPKANEVVSPIWSISGFLLIVSIGLGKLFFKNKKDQN